MAAALARDTSGHKLSSGILDLGGVTVDLGECHVATWHTWMAMSCDHRSARRWLPLSTAMLGMRWSDQALYQPRYVLDPQACLCCHAHARHHLAAAGGGDYLISAPVVWPPYTGNFRMIDGTLRASAVFPMSVPRVHEYLDATARDSLLHLLCLCWMFRAAKPLK